MSRDPDRALRAAVAYDGGERLSTAQRERFVGHLSEILLALGLPVDTAATRGTPARLLEALVDATGGYDHDPHLVTLFPVEAEAPARSSQQVVEAHIPFTAMCEHHALPFFGHVAIGYVPAAQLLGLSKLTRLVRHHARRFTMQERLGDELAAALEGITRACGTAVQIEGVHLCTRMRGVCETEAVTRTLHWRGMYCDSTTLRGEFLQLCARR